MRAAAVVAGLAALVALHAAEPAAEAPRPPDVVLVLLDDLSAKELGCYGHPTHRTPVLDRLAREGVQFRTAWATPMCAPSRALLLTGRYAQRTQYWDNAVPAPAPLWKHHRMLGQRLQDAGYRTGMYGKTHFGEDPARDCGFHDYAIARDWPGFDGPRFAARNLDRSQYGTPWYWHPAHIANGTGIDTGPDDFGPALELEHALRFAADAAQRQQPFFLYHATFLPHQFGTSARDGTVTWSYPEVPELDAEGRPTGRRRPPELAEVVAYIDGAIGRLVEGLDRAGALGRTVVIITADNGTAGYGKGRLESEVALRVPFIVWGPGVVPARGAVDDLIDFSDVMPTLLDLAGRPAAAEAELDGTSFAPLLRAQPFAGRDMIFSYSGSARWLRDRRWLRDGTGRLWDCGDVRDEWRGYRDATEDRSPEAEAARARFAERLRALPGPDPADPAIGPALRRWMKAHPEAR